jgi:hypothetical protein
MDMLERAFTSEVNGENLFQTKSRLAEVLAEDGYLEEASYTIEGRFPVIVKGYRLTHLGRLTYCLSCEDDDADA